MTLYNKTRQILLQNVTAILLQNAIEVYYKVRQMFYYKMRQFYYKIRQLLRNATILLQNATFITNCDSTPPDRVTSKANLSSRNSQSDESNHFKQLDQISSFYDLILMLVNSKRIFTNDMHIIVNELHIILQTEKLLDGTDVSKFSKNCDSHCYASEYGNYLHELGRGGFKVPGDNNLFLLTGDCYLWIYYFLPSSEITCRTSLTNVLMIVSNIYRLDFKINHGLILLNILFNSYYKLYFPRSKKEPTQQLLKLSDS